MVEEININMGNLIGDTIIASCLLSFEGDLETKVSQELRHKIFELLINNGIK